MDHPVIEDTPSHRPSVSYDRPSRTPYGPRIRVRRKISGDLPSIGASSPDEASLSSAIGSPTFANPLSLPDSPESELASLSIDASFSDSATPHPTLSLKPRPELTAEQAVQVPSTPPSSPIPLAVSSLLAPTHSKKLSSESAKPPAATFIAPPPLPAPPKISFEPLTIPWKGLPFEVAQWTFSSEELQEIVSKAIRLSAKESFVRLLSLQALEVDIVKESERLESERLAAQAKWRFEVGRRTMLMQALNSTAAMFGSTAEAEGGKPLSGLISQLASAISSCDSVLSSIRQYADQESQITVLQQTHWSSALAIALRKLNRAYERQTEELKRVKARVQTLEDELDDAWREAERMAVEFDDMEQEVGTSEGEAEAESSKGVNDGEKGGDEDAVKQDHEDNVSLNTDLGEVMGVTATAVVSKATLLNSPISPKIDKSDTKSVRSIKSTRSRRSVRDGPSYVSRLVAARTRSRVASNASLRLPKSIRNSSISQTQTPLTEVPPVPSVPDRPDRAQGQSFLDMGNIGTEFIRQIKKSLPSRLSESKEAPPGTEPPYTASIPRTRFPSVMLKTDSGSTTRLNGLDRIHSLQIFPSLSRLSLRKERRSNLVMSLSCESEFGESAGSPVSTRSNKEISTAKDRPGSAGGQLTNNNEVRTPKKSLVSRASSVMLRRISRATSPTKQYTSSLSTYKTEEEDETDTPPRAGTPNTG